MVSCCNFCRWVTADIKTFCPYCGRGIDLDFERTEEELLAEGYISFGEFHPSQTRCTSDAGTCADGTESSGKNESADTAAFNENFAKFCGTSVIGDERDYVSAGDGIIPSEHQPIITPVRRDTVNSSSADEGDFDVKIDSSAVDSFRNGYSGFSTGADGFINVNTESGGTTSGTGANGESLGDFGLSGASASRNVNTRDSSYEDEYERQRRAAVARERRQAFFDRLRLIRPRTVIRVIAVIAFVGLAAYVWSMRYVIIESVTDFLTSLIGPLVLILIIGSLVGSLFRRRR